MFVPPKRIRPSAWAERYRQISEKTAEMSGQFSWMLVPYLRGIIDSIFEQGVRGIRCMKSAQVGWSESVLCNLLGYFIDMMPASMIVLFPKLEKGKEFNLERFEPMVECTPRLVSKVPLKSREKGVTQTYKSFAGGWLKFVGSHSASNVKSSSARYVFVEEPDDCEADVKGQGSTIKLLRERLKTYYDTLSIMGGTPTLKGLSAIEQEMELTDKRVWYVPCHHCGEFAPLEWANVRCRHDEAVKHPVYGTSLPDTTFYACPACGGEWNDAERARNARNGKWIATAPFTGLAGFYLNDLVSSFPGAALPELMRKYLEAQHEAEQGDVKALVEFYNNQLGVAFEYTSGAPNVEELERRSEDYVELTVPWGGMRLTLGADIQGNRIALVVVAWGRGEESWRVYWGEIYGNTVDHDDPVWTELEQFLFRPYRHASGAEIHIEAASIDSSDGNTSDAVYWFCRKHRHRGVMAIKGFEDGEIFRQPKPIDPSGRRLSKASRYGLAVHPVGTSKAKDLIIGFGDIGGRLRLCANAADGKTGTGAGRMHWYRGIRGDYFEQVTAEVKAPMRGKQRNRLYWQVKQGKRNEALDCEVYALHASRKLRVNLMTEAQWQMIEQRLRQPDLVAIAASEPEQAVHDEPAPEPVAAEQTVEAAATARRPRPSVNAALIAQLTPGGSRPHSEVPPESGAPY